MIYDIGFGGFHYPAAKLDGGRLDKELIPLVDVEADLAVGQTCRGHVRDLVLSAHYLRSRV